MTTYYCQFKPDTVATYYCHSCHTYSCDEFSKENSQAECRCFLCNSDLESLGTGSAAEPFWRRLDQTFRYAFNVETLIFIAGTSILSTFLMFAPGIWARVLQLMVASAYIKYCFVCLQSTAFGDMKPPSITESYNDGIYSLLKLGFVFFAIFGMCALAITFLGINLGALLSVLLICALPAAIIILALEDSPLSAVNPLKLGWIIKSIGLGYGVLLAFLLIMSSSVAILSNLFVEGFSVFGAILQSFISSFYTVVMFHMMGYMIYQYQSSLGFSARDDSFTRTIRSDAQKRKANIKALLREAKFEEVSKLYASECKQNRSDAALYKDYFKYLLAIKDTKNLAAFGNSYLKLLTETSRFEEARLTYKQLINDVPTFQLSSAHVRYTLAKSFHEVNDSLLAVKIIHGMHKENPDFEKLPEAYAFCADILDTMDGRQKAANDFRRYSQKLAQERTQQAQQRANNLNNMLVAKNSPVTEQTQQTPHTPQKEYSGSAGLSLVPID